MKWLQDLVGCMDFFVFFAINLLLIFCIVGGLLFLGTIYYKLIGGLCGS